MTQKHIKNCLFLLFCALLLSSCLSLKIVLHLPEKKGAAGRLELEYSLSERLQNISNYPAPRDDIAPLPLPLWEWDFRAIAVQSEGIELQNYDFQRAKKTGERGTVLAELSFDSEEDLQLLLGPEIQWDGANFRWKLSARDAERPDSSYPMLDGDLSEQEQKILRDIFAEETLELVVYSGGEKFTQSILMADFLLGTKDLQIP